MPVSDIHKCGCPNCQQAADHPDKKLHQQMNLLMSRLDEQQRRWYVALEANRLGHGGVRRLAQVTGLDEKTMETLLAYIRGTTTRTGLQVTAFRVEQVFEKGIKVLDETMDRLNLDRHDTCPNWNYTIRPRTACCAVPEIDH